jgi:hypothetical protein
MEFYYSDNTGARLRIRLTKVEENRSFASLFLIAMAGDKGHDEIRPKAGMKLTSKVPKDFGEP